MLYLKRLAAFLEKVTSSSKCMEQTRPGQGPPAGPELSSDVCRKEKQGSRRRDQATASVASGEIKGPLLATLQGPASAGQRRGATKAVQTGRLGPA